MDSDRRLRILLAACAALAGLLGIGFWAYTRPDFVASLASLSFLCQ
jgi:hypothetical protein